MVLHWFIMHTQTCIIQQGIKFEIACLLLKLGKHADWIAKHTQVMIFSSNVSPQYVGAPRGRKLPAGASPAREIVGSSR